MDRSSIFDAIVKLNKGKDDPTLLWPITRPSLFQGAVDDVIAPHLTGPGINPEDVGPLSRNVEDRRGENYAPGLLDMIISKLNDIQYNARTDLTPSNPDLDASVKRMKQFHAITPVLEELARREQGFRLIDEEHPREQRDEIKRDYERLKKKKKNNDRQ